MHDSVSPVAYRARWVFPVDRPPIANGIVSVVGGRIVSVGESTEAANVIDLGNAAILPALVNAHTHLEFSLFERPFGEPGESFANWLRKVVRWRREQPAVQGQERLALEHGLRECQAAGVGVLGEITTPLFADVWKDSHATTVSVQFLELLSLNPERVPALTDLAEQFTRNTEAASVGLSPHAPYTVHPELLSRAVHLSAERKLPLQMHLAESREELELLQSQTGELVELLQSLTAWYPQSLSKGLRPLDYLQTLAQAHRAVIAHGNFLQADEIAFVAQQRERMSVGYCPRTQAYFNHGPYPLAAMLAAGVRVAVGTDSRASNPDLSVWRELQFIREQHPQIDPSTILKMGTISGAEALGIATDFGTLTPGKVAALTAVNLPPDCDPPYEALFAPLNHPALLHPPPGEGAAER
jgi:cytosine/adenosine deaminase-related metal-dependent hydrolase